MNEFSLSRSRRKVLPETVQTKEGREITIDSDFRTVLKCIRVLDDPDVSERDKLYLLMRWFFRGELVPDAYSLFAEFVSGDSEADGEPPVMDFEQDADAIYAGFLMDYGIDLLDVKEMHWAKFRALLSGLSDKTALCQRMALRRLDTKDLKGKARADAERAKRRVQLKKRMSEEEAGIRSEIETALANGQDPAEAVEKLRVMAGEQL